MKNSAATMMLCTTNLLMSQVPSAFSYKGVAMEACGTATINKQLSLKLTLVDAGASEKEIYSEAHAVESNQDGLFNINIGQGTPIDGTFDNIKNETHYIKVEMDKSGGSNYQYIGNVALKSIA